MTLRAIARLWPLVWLALVEALDPLPAVGHEEPHRAGLVVRHGDGRLTYAYVTFREEEISGIELLRRSGLPLVTVGFGGLGEAVCALEGEGCSTGECRRNLCQGAPEEPFWQPCYQTTPGAWQVWRLGASSAKIRDGDVYGWSWGGCGAGLPVTTIADVARLVDVPDPPVAGSDGTGPGAAVRTVYPPGVEPERERPRQEVLTYAVAVGLLALIGATAGYAALRTRRSG